MSQTKGNVFRKRKNKYKDERSIKMSYGLWWHTKQMSRVIALFKHKLTTHEITRI